MTAEEVFEKWCPVKIIDESKAPIASGIKQCYHTAWMVCWDIAQAEAAREMRERCAEVGDQFGSLELGRMIRSLPLPGEVKNEG